MQVVNVDGEVIYEGKVERVQDGYDKHYELCEAHGEILDLMYEWIEE
jgi:hypothetical protein